MNRVMLYQPKTVPMELLSKLKKMLKDFPEITKAFYCMGSYLYNSKITEKNIIGIQIQDKNNKKNFLKLLNVTRIFGEENTNIIFVSSDDEHFSKYFLGVCPFYLSNIN